MKSLRIVLSMVLSVTAFFLITDFGDPGEAQARPLKCALVDDDWEPSEGKSSGIQGRYTVDPEYQFYIAQALNLAGFNFDIYEIWPDGASMPDRPSLAELSDYQLVIWNCAANDSAVLQTEEMQLLVAYMNLGGKVLLSGQGILDDLIRNQGDPVADEFLLDILGIEQVFLNSEAVEIQPIPFGYFGNLGTVFPAYGTLPDTDPSLVDPFYTMPFMDAYMVGTFPGLPDILLPVSSNRFKWQPLHFQSFMAEAIASPLQRANWLAATMEWLGFEGDNLYDFMIGYEDLAPTLTTPPHAVVLDIDDYHLIFHADGAEPGETRLEKSLAPLGGDWRIGETFQVSTAGVGSEMRLMSLEGNHGVELSIRSSLEWPGLFEMLFTLYEDGDAVYQDSFDGLATGEFYRAQLRYRTDTGSEIIAQLTDSLGNVHWTSSTIFLPSFDHFALIARGEGIAGALPIHGWIDDLFFQGSLSHDGGTPVAVGFFELQPSEGGVDLRWEVEGGLDYQFRLDRDGESVAFEDLGGSFLARDRDPALAAGGRFSYELSGRSENEEWNLLRREDIQLEVAGRPALRLLGAVPNPFNPSTEIRYELDSPGRVHLAVYDLEGRLLRVLLDAVQTVGPGSVEWRGRDEAGRSLPSGVYLLKLAGHGGLETTKLVLLK